MPAQTATGPHILFVPVSMVALQIQLIECVVVYLHYFMVPRSLAV